MNETWWVSETQLNDEQRGTFNNSPLESGLIIGPPGSGKTNLLLLRASQLVRSNQPNILILVFTRTLRDFISTGGPKYAFSTEKIKTCMGWAIDFLKSEGEDHSAPGTFEQKRRTLLQRVRDVVRREGYGKLYEAIILDEVQDYYPDELELFFEIANVVHAAGDSRQQIYPNDSDYFDRLKAKFGDNVSILKFHYRNGVAICSVADELGKVRANYIPMLPTCNYPEKQKPSKVEPKIHPNLESEIYDIVDKITIQLDAYPEEFIGIICPNHDILSQVAALLKESKIALHICIQGKDNGGLFMPGKPVCICTAHSAKGLEFRAAYIVQAAEFKGKLTRNIAYTSVTRAKSYLGIFSTTGIPGYLEQALKAVNPQTTKPVQLNELFGS